MNSNVNSTTRYFVESISRALVLFAIDDVHLVGYGASKLKQLNKPQRRVI